MDNNIKKVKRSIFARQKNTIIALAVIFAVLLCAYIFIIRPLMKDDSETASTPISLIWENEIESGGTVMMFEHIERASISEIKVHNPSLLSKYGEAYVDWSIYRATEDTTVGGYAIEKDSLYLKGYEYAPLNDNDTNSVIASIVNDAGFPLTVSRVIDHAEDFSKYGLDFESEDDATYCEIITVSNKTYKFYVGDKIPSGTAYYVRMAGKDVCTDKNSEFYGQEIENDSVYIYDCSGILVSPTEAVSPILTYPLNTSLQAYFDSFEISEYVDSADSSDRKQEAVVKLISARGKDYLSKPVSAFAQEAIYYTETPAGYYSSSAFEDLFEDFANGLSGAKVCELATLLDGEEDGKTYKYYGFEDSVRDKYFEGGVAYNLSFYWNEIRNELLISHLTENGTYYVYSLVYNTICEVSAETLSFIAWDQSMFIDRKFFSVSIYNCSNFSVKGKYYDFSLDGDYTEKDVNVSFDVETDSNNKQKVTSDNFVENGKMSASERTKNFRELYSLLLLSYLNEMLSDEEVEEICQGEAFAEISISTRNHTTSIIDPTSQTEEEITLNVPGMTRVYRFYKFSSGRCLVTTQDKIEGEASKEIGRFYMLNAKVEQILKAAEKVANDEPISSYERD